MENPRSATQPLAAAAALIQRTPSLADQTYTAVKSLVVSGAMPPGSTHTEAALARELGISRAPLREALRTLEEEGFIDSQLPQQGFRVTPITRADVANLYEVRIALEGVAAYNATGHVPRESLDEMARTLDRLDEQLEHDDTSEYLAHEFPFHNLWVRNSANPLLIRHIDRLRDHVLRVVNHVELPLEHTIASLAEHHDILDAFLEDGDPNAVQAAVVRHTKNVSARIDAYMSALEE